MKLLSALLLFCVAVPLFCLAAKPQTHTGLVRLTGTALFPQLVLTVENEQDYIFDERLFNDFKMYAGTIITIEATISTRQRVLADNSKAFTDYIITQACLIQTE